MNEPIIIEEFDPNWEIKYKDAKNRILEKIGQFVIAIEHIGSTAISGLASKPIIDILIGLHSLDDAKKCIPLIIDLGYEYIPEHERVLPERRYFRKPKKGFGKREFHLHMVEFNSDFWTKQILFRDYIKTHPEALIEYEKLKQNLAEKYRDNRQAYTDGKDEFIQKILEKAKKAINL